MDTTPTSRPSLVITIDTESDDLWARRPELTFENIRYLPRIQNLLDDYGLRPTYLVSYPVATSKIGRQILSPMAQTGRAEFGSHMHVWTTPPLERITAKDWEYCPLATEIPYDLLAGKLENVTRAVGELAGRKPESHRAGRFAFDRNGLRALRELGYLVDSSVTPLVAWTEPSHTGGLRGPDFRSAPLVPYYPSEEDVNVAGTGAVLEVPVSFFLNRRLPQRIANWLSRMPRDNNLVRALRWSGLVRHGWLYPGRKTSGPRLIGIARALLAFGVPTLNVMFHSSELAPNTSPNTRTLADVEDNYRQLKVLFDYLVYKEKIRSLTLSEFAAYWRNNRTAPRPAVASIEQYGVQHPHSV